MHWQVPVDSELQLNLNVLTIDLNGSRTVIAHAVTVVALAASSTSSRPATPRERTPNSVVRVVIAEAGAMPNPRLFALVDHHRGHARDAQCSRCHGQTFKYYYA